MTHSTPSSAPAQMSMQQLNLLSPTQFVDLLGEVFEHSSWVAESALAHRPFADLDALHQAMVHTVQVATAEAQLALLRAHPELAGREAQLGELTAASTKEQARAGLNALTPEEMARIVLLNKTYQARHGFPFIVCVGRHTKDSIFKEFERRADNATTMETQEALAQVAEIARLRLEKLLIV